MTWTFADGACKYNVIAIRPSLSVTYIRYRFGCRVSLKTIALSEMFRDYCRLHSSFIYHCKRWIRRLIQWMKRKEKDVQVWLSRCLSSHDVWSGEQSSGCGEWLVEVVGFLNFPCIQTRYILSCRPLFTWRRLSTKSWSWDSPAPTNMAETSSGEKRKGIL